MIFSNKIIFIVISLFKKNSYSIKAQFFLQKNFRQKNNKKPLKFSKNS